jgi:hypothetical protein
MEPTKSILKNAQRAINTLDARGRSLVCRRPTALDTLRLFKAAGPTLAQNEAWLAMASLAFAVEAIDGVPVPAPGSEAQIEALVERLGDDGLSAIAAAVESPEDKTNLESQVGNLQGTLS